jgi:hypothetical protein
VVAVDGEVDVVLASGEVVRCGSVAIAAAPG